MQPLTLSLIQSEVSWHDCGANLNLFSQLLQQVPDNTDLVLLPEMFSTGFTMASEEVAQTMQGEAVTWLRDKAAEIQKHICASVVISDAGRYYNRFLCADPTGALHHYDKRHLFRMADEHQHYSAGENRLIFEVKGWRVLASVCYDLRFPVWLRNTNDYDLMVCVANWPAARQSAWNTLLRARSIENQTFVAGVNRVGTDGNGVVYAGGSGIYAPDGEILAEQLEVADIISVSLNPATLLSLRTSFPVWQDADGFQLDEQDTRST
ncbi:MAG: amidohydrolase [Pseudomonadaceae bacterium]|nr:amidohydrolase [Pseudomonadaceae bacterium]